MCLSERNNIPHDQLGRKVFDCTNIGLDPIADTCDYINLKDISNITCSETDLVLMQLNVRGLISKQNELSKLINTCLKDKKIDVIILCETWVTKDTRQLINVPGYQYVGIERQNKKGGGVGFLIANEIHFTHRPAFNLMEENIEHCGIEIATKGRNIMCTSVY